MLATTGGEQCGRDPKREELVAPHLGTPLNRRARLALPREHSFRLPGQRQLDSERGTVPDFRFEVD
jgi:hypothetical protein